MKILLVGALHAETLPVRRRLGLVGARRLATGDWLGLQIALLRCGVGPARAERRTREALKRFDADLVLSFGTCGSLVDELGLGTVVELASVRARGGEPRRLGERGVHCVTVKRGVFDPRERAELAALGCQVCEMEAHAVMMAAGDRRFRGLKVVSDFASAPPSRLGFGLHAWRLSAAVLAPALEDFLEDETKALLTRL